MVRLHLTPLKKSAPKMERLFDMNEYEPASDEERAWLEAYDPSAYPGVSLTSDIVVFTIRQGQLSVLLVERGGFPYRGSWALPGGFVNSDENAEEGARRELQEETAIDVSTVYLEQLKTYATPGRDPRMRVISIAHVALLPDLPNPTGGDDAASARWWAVSDLDLEGTGDPDLAPLAFDHAEIVKDGLERVRSKLEYAPIAHQFLEETFTLADLRRVYEAVWGANARAVRHAPNFRRKVLSTPGFVEPVGHTGPSQTGGRQAALYRAGSAQLLHPAILRDM
jgi:8-oxo-dGTP diphosphatase